ncbi:MAG TPA: 5'-methylthioadenosine/adenosylhomocysteine nucleosidase [Candidatus Pullichristensenella avicola]|nr:5'-methylthioadenosine/adenosylhomocysteine nucleosidase [Candidatus Pullichristensenella avicola]
MIGVIGALDIEIERLVEKMERPVRREVSGIPFVCGSIHGVETVVARAGVGKVNAAVCAQTMALVYEPELIVNTGVSGALSQELRVGDIVVGTDVVQHDMDTTPMGEAPGTITIRGVDMVAFACDRLASTAICTAAADLGIRVVRGRIASGDQFVASSARKREIVRLFSAATCEMEAGAIAQVCRMNDIPCAVIRCISDGGNEEAPMSYEEFLPMAAKNSAALTLEFLKIRGNL